MNVDSRTKASMSQIMLQKQNNREKFNQKSKIRKTFRIVFMKFLVEMHLKQHQVMSNM